MSDSSDDRILLIRHRYGSRSQIRRMDALDASQIQADVEVLLGAVDRLTRERDAIAERVKNYLVGDCYICHHDAEIQGICSRCHDCLPCRLSKVEAACAALRRERDQLQEENQILLTRCYGTGEPIPSSPTRSPQGDK